MWDDEQLQAAFDQIPVLAGKREITELSGGLTNRNLKVVTAQGTYVARCNHHGSDLLGIDRDHEHHNSRAAEQAGVGAPVVDYRPDLAILVIGYIDGITYDNDSFQHPGVVERAAHACRTLHTGPRFLGTFNMFVRQAGYLATVLERGIKFPDDYRDHLDTFGDVERALAVNAKPPVPCNNDLLAGNFVDDGEKLWLIDYEYSGNNDACFELGNIWSECALTTDQLELLVTSYYGRTLRNKVARARLQGIVAKYGWTLWGCIQAATSPVDFDFWAWGMERYEAAVAEFRGPDLPRLLDDVQRTD